MEEALSGHNEARFLPVQDQCRLRNLLISLMIISPSTGPRGTNFGVLFEIERAGPVETACLPC